MRILSVITCYNEIDYLPLQLEFLEQNGVEYFVLDNYSTDGSWEWLQDNRVPSERVDTKDSFHLDLLQAARLRVLARERPEWAIYGDSDELIFTASTIADVVRAADAEGADLLEIPFLNLFQTDEQPECFDPVRTYFYYELPKRWKRTRIHRYHPSLRYRADEMQYDFEPRTKPVPGVICNYGGTKSGKRRAETLKRRKRAWKMGFDKNFGTHYLDQKRQGWSRRKEELTDLRLSAYYPFVEAHLDRIPVRPQCAAHAV